MLCSSSNVKISSKTWRSASQNQIHPRSHFLNQSEIKIQFVLTVFKHHISIPDCSQHSEAINLLKYISKFFKVTLGLKFRGGGLLLNLERFSMPSTALNTQVSQPEHSLFFFKKSWNWYQNQNKYVLWSF